MGISAKERKKRFLENKQGAGGAQALIDQQKNKPYRVYFNDDGEIMCFTSDENQEISPEWNTHDFNQEQLQILKEKDLTRFRIKKDDKVENLYSIELRPLETVYVSANEDFLYEVKSTDEKDADITVEIKKDKLLIELSKTVKKTYKDVYPISATVKGSRLLKFYITAKNDPHEMYHYSVVSLSDLLSNKQVKIDLDDDLQEYSVFTNKLFDTYNRI